MSSQELPETTSEYFESIGLNISQPKSGHRYGAESIALADFCRVRECDRVVELGSGSGVISLIIAARDKPERVVAIEIQQELHRIAVANVAANQNKVGLSFPRKRESIADTGSPIKSLGDNKHMPISQIVECVNADYRKFAVENKGMFDVAVANPPFYRVGSGRISGDPVRAAARHELNGTIEELLKAAHQLLVGGGRFALVFPVERLRDLELAIKSTGFKVVQILDNKAQPSLGPNVLVKLLKDENL